MKCITSNNLRILILLGCLSYTTVLAASKGDKNSKSPTPPTPSENHDASEGENINPRTLAHRIAVENIELHPVGIEAENRSEVRKRRGRKLSRGRVNAVSNKFISLDPEGMHLLNKIIKHPQHGAAAGILKLLTHRQVADALRAFKKLPPERRKEVVYSRYGGSIPKEYLVVTSRGIDKIPLTAGFLESLYQVFHNGNVHYVVHSVMNGMTYLVIGGLVLSEPVFLARIVLNDAQATILEGSVETGCGNSTNDPDFRFVDPVIGSFTQRLILTEAGLVQQAVFGSLIVLGPRVLRLPLMGGLFTFIVRSLTSY